MRRPSPMLTAAEVRREAVARLVGSLQLRDVGTALTATVLAQVLVLAAVVRGSISAVARRCHHAPGIETVRKGLLAQLPDDEELRRRIVAALHAPLPAALRRRPVPLAIDLTLIPFYGDKATPGLWRGRSKAGTSRYWAYASAEVLRPGRRFDVALTPVVAGDPLERVVERLLEQVAAAGLSIAYLVLDRGFYAANVIATLQRRGVAFVLPVVRRGRKADDPRGPGGTQAFFAREAGGFTTHTWTGRKKGDPTVTVGIGIVPREGRAPLVYAFDGVKPGGLRWLVETYRRRFGIESGYRQLRRCLARTTGRDPRVRLLLVGVALMVRNLWVWLHWAVLSPPRRGGRSVRLGRLRLETMLTWLARTVEERLGLMMSVPCGSPNTVGV